MPSREQIIEAFWKAVPAGAGWPELSAGILVEVVVDGDLFTVDTKADGPFMARPRDQYLLVLEQYAVDAALAAFEPAQAAA